MATAGELSDSCGVDVSLSTVHDFAALRSSHFTYSVKSPYFCVVNIFAVSATLPCPASPHQSKSRHDHAVAKSQHGPTHPAMCSPHPHHRLPCDHQELHEFHPRSVAQFDTTSDNVGDCPCGCPALLGFTSQTPPLPQRGAVSLSHRPRCGRRLEQALARFRFSHPHCPHQTSVSLWIRCCHSHARGRSQPFETFVPSRVLDAPRNGVPTSGLLTMASSWMLSSCVSFPSDIPSFFADSWTTILLEWYFTGHPTSGQRNRARSASKSIKVSVAQFGHASDTNFFCQNDAGERHV